jgi:zinc and cadmium transporter
MVLLHIIIATVAISVISLVGIAALSMKEKQFRKILLLLVGFSTGTLFAAAFFHLLPEAAEKLGETAFGLALVGILAFFVIEKLICWHHCHSRKHEIHSIAYMNLVGDGIHNLLDGVIIAASFITSVPIGIATTIAVAAHEIPQEIGDYSLLTYSGFSRKKALLYNFFTALTAIIGGIFTYFFAQQATWFSSYMLPIAAGGFVYIAAADLLPELKKEARLETTALQMAFILAGVAVLLAAKMLFPE